MSLARGPLPALFLLRYGPYPSYFASWVPMQIIDNRALLLTTKKADQIVSLIPKSKLLDRQGELGRVLVNWGFDEARILRNLRIKDVPSPILGRYKWPGLPFYLICPICCTHLAFSNVFSVTCLK